MNKFLGFVAQIISYIWKNSAVLFNTYWLEFGMRQIINAILQQDFIALLTEFF